MFSTVRHINLFEEYLLITANIHLSQYRNKKHKQSKLHVTIGSQLPFEISVISVKNNFRDYSGFP